MATTVDAAANGSEDNDEPALPAVRLSSPPEASGQLRNRFSASSPSTVVIAPALPTRGRGRTNPVTRALGMLLHGTGQAFGFILALLLLLLMAIPPIAFVALGGWSVWIIGHTIGDAAHAVRTLRFDLLSDRLDTLGMGVRGVLLCLSFFAVILALSVLFGGLLAQGRRQWLAAVGMLLALLTMSSYFLTAYSLVNETPRLGLPEWAAIAFGAYALLDAATIAVALTDTRPPDPRRRTPPGEPALATSLEAVPLVPAEEEDEDERYRTVMLPETRRWGTPPSGTSERNTRDVPLVVPVTTPSRRNTGESSEL